MERLISICVNPLPSCPWSALETLKRQTQASPYALLGRVIKFVSRRGGRAGAGGVNILLLLWIHHQGNGGLGMVIQVIWEVLTLLYIRFVRSLHFVGTDVIAVSAMEVPEISPPVVTVADDA